MNSELRVALVVDLHELTVNFPSTQYQVLSAAHHSLDNRKI